MKTTIEINGYNIVIEDNEGVISVTAQKDDETVEEFTVDTNEEGSEEGQGSEEGEEMKEFGQEETEAGEEIEDAGEEIEGAGEEMEEEGQKLESFKSFISKRKA